MSQETIESLKGEVERLRSELAQARAQGGAKVRAKIDVMSAEVVDSNPYRCALSPVLPIKLNLLIC